MNWKKSICTATLVAAFAVSPVSATVDDGGLLEAIRSCANEYLGSNKCSDLDEMIDQLRGRRSDGSYEYYKYVAKGNGTNGTGSVNVSREAGDFVEDLGFSGNIYKLKIEVQKGRGWGRPNIPFTIKKIEYKAISQEGVSGYQVENVNQTIERGNSREFDLKHIAQGSTLKITVSHQGVDGYLPNSWSVNRPNFIVTGYKSIQEDVDNPNQDRVNELVEIRQSGNKAKILSDMGVPEYEIPPARVRFSYQQPSFPSGVEAERAKARVTSASRMDNARGILEYVKEAQDVPTYSRAFRDRLSLIYDYAMYAKTNNSEIALGYAKSMLNELADKSYYFTPEQNNTHEDPAGDWGDGPNYGGVNEDPAGDWGDNGGYGSNGTNPAGDWGNSGNSNNSNSDPAGDWGDNGSYNNSGSDAGNWGDTPSASNSIANRTIETYKGKRVYDRLSNGKAEDVKRGRISTSTSIRSQIEKDRLILNDSRFGVRNIVWIFKKDSSSKCGPTDTVRTLLREAGVVIDDKACRSGSYYDSGASDSGDWGTGSDYQSGSGSSDAGQW
jgi:hypothetical protein